VTVRHPRILAYLLAFALGTGAAVGLAACGGGSSKALIPSADAGPLRDDFDAVASAIDSGDCPGTQRALARAQGDLDQLPARVSKRLRTRIQQGINTLAGQAAKECQANQTTTATTTTTTPTTTTPTTTETTPTVPTTTETTPTTPTTTTPTTPTTTSTTGGDSGGVTVP
jgi:hypothetical protein